jgi:hypothetical protein
MESKNNIEIDGESYLLFASENVKRVLLKNKVAALSLVKMYKHKPFTKKGTSSIAAVGETNLCILNIEAFDFDTQQPTKCFILHCVGNYKELIPVAPNKWSVTLYCGHKAIIDETVDSIDKNHKVECFLCKKHSTN